MFRFKRNESPQPEATLEANHCRPVANLSPWLRGFLLLVLLLVFAGLWRSMSLSPLPPKGWLPSNGPESGHSPQPPLYEVCFASHDRTPWTHCSTVVETEEGFLRAFWYGGPDEGARESAIYTALFDSQTGKWDFETALITREDVQKDLRRHIKTLGNPVAFKDRNGRLWLFYVSVSFGGWSGSAINFTTSYDDGKTWEPHRRIVTSPFFNLSTLVKGRPFLFEDGTLGLPVYHEFIGKFGELLRLDPIGAVVFKGRLSWGRSSLQPVVIPITEKTGVCLMRYCGPYPSKMLSLRTRDGGATWTSPEKTEVPNPNAAISGLLLNKGGLLLVFNNSDENRKDLSLAYSDNRGKTWRLIHAFEKETALEEDHLFSYPCLIRDGKGVFHLLYTWHKRRIKHVRFNREWLEQKLL